MRDAIWSRTLPAESRATLLASDPIPRAVDVAIIGAGLVGLCAAWELHRRQAGQLLVLDRGSVCGGASGASAGGLWPSHECFTLGSPEIARRSAACHARLRAEFACDYVPSGLLALYPEEQRDRARDRVERSVAAGFAAELLDEFQLRECEPLLDHRGHAVRFPGDGSLHPLKLAAALVRRLRAGGVRICLSAGGARIAAPAGAVVTERGRISAGTVIVAAGAWTPQLTRLLGWEPPIRPIRGALLSTESRPAGTVRSVVVGPRYYYWQLACGPVAGGGSEEDVGFAEGVDAAVVASVREEFDRLFPALSGVPFTCRWSGFRPFSEDLQPVVGRLPGYERIYVSAGHFRKGILLAPLSGELLAEEILENRRWAPAASFRPERFGAQPAVG